MTGSSHSDTTRPTSSYLLTTPTPNPNGDHSSGKSTISILVLASVVIVSAVIVALTIMVFTLCCCLCGWCMCCDGCMHFKSKVYQHCQQKGKTTQKGSNWAMLHMYLMNRTLSANISVHCTTLMQSMSYACHCANVSISVVPFTTFLSYP